MDAREVPRALVHTGHHLALADWLIDQGHEDLALEVVRGKSPTWAVNEWERREYYKRWRAMVDPIIEDLLAKSATAYAEHRPMAGYWFHDEAHMIRLHCGIIKVVYHADLRRKPPPGHVFVRPSRPGRWGTCRKNKFGRWLTWEELR